VAYPTESCYGLGCDPDNEAAIKRLLKLKKRPRAKGLILIAEKFERLKPFLLPLPEEKFQLMMNSWPGPYTWVCPSQSHTSRWLTGDHKTLAVRVTAHPVAARLCQQAGMAIVSTSANVSAQPALRNAASVKRYFADEIDAIVNGSIGYADAPSTITNAITGEIIRS